MVSFSAQDDALRWGIISELEVRKEGSETSNDRSKNIQPGKWNSNPDLPELELAFALPVRNIGIKL